MNFSIMQETETLRSTVLAVRTSSLASRSLVHVLMESCSENRIYYSIVSALFPCSDPQEDICIVHDITGEKEKAAGLFHLLADNTVTPCTLEDVLSDLL